MNLNRAMIIGNLTRDPELRTTPSGQSVCTLGIATNRRWKDAAGERKEEVEYHSVVAWGKLAEIASQYLSRGRKVYAEGRLRTREWEGKDGLKHNRTEIIAENLILLDRPPQTVGAPDAAQAFAPQGAALSAPIAAAAPTGEEEIKVEDIPF